MAKHLYLVLDTETANCFSDEKGGLDFASAQVYDLGYAIVDRYGTVYDSGSYVIRETFGNDEMMRGAYYADKIPQYITGLAHGEHRMISIDTAREIIRALCKQYNIKAICAHNARFDYTSLNATIRYNTKSKYRYFYPYGVEVWDTLKMSRDIFGNMPTYRKFCENNGYMTKHKTPRPRMTAEVIYRFISGDTNFDEKHTGLADVMIEKEILARCFRAKKKMRRKLWED